MSDETTLLPCPFCGSENVGTSYKDTFSGDFRRGVYCGDCCGGIYPYYDTEAEAIAAWNTRADYHGYEQAAIEAWESIKAWNAREERTCRIIEYDEAPYPVCSECGAVQPDDYTVYFCWNCGAKVRDE